MTDTCQAPDRQPAATALLSVSARCARISKSSTFTVATFVLIVANAAVLGTETYSGVARTWESELTFFEHLFMVAFTAEMVIRLLAYGNRPGGFFREGWNVFDLVVVLASFVPVIRENATILRLLRLARVLRAIRMFPQVRIILVAAWKSLPGALSFLVVGALVVYVYAMVGWMLFAETMPQHYGSIGRAALSLFFLMALDGLSDMVREGLEVSRWTLVYFGSYVLLSSFLLVNLLIGVVITSLEDARGSVDETPNVVVPQHGAPHARDRELLLRVAELRAAADAIERELMGRSGPPIPVEQLHPRRRALSLWS